MHVKTFAQGLAQHVVCVQGALAIISTFSFPSISREAGLIGQVQTGLCLLVGMGPVNPKHGASVSWFECFREEASQGVVELECKPRSGANVQAPFTTSGC